MIQSGAPKKVESASVRPVATSGTAMAATGTQRRPRKTQLTAITRNSETPREAPKRCATASLRPSSTTGRTASALVRPNSDTIIAWAGSNSLAPPSIPLSRFSKAAISGQYIL